MLLTSGCDRHSVVLKHGDQAARLPSMGGKPHTVTSHLSAAAALVRLQRKEQIF